MEIVKLAIGKMVNLLATVESTDQMAPYFKKAGMKNGTSKAISRKTPKSISIGSQKKNISSKYLLNEIFYSDLDIKRSSYILYCSR